MICYSDGCTRLIRSAAASAPAPGAPTALLESNSSVNGSLSTISANSEAPASPIRFEDSQMVVMGLFFLDVRHSLICGRGINGANVTGEQAEVTGSIVRTASFKICISESSIDEELSARVPGTCVALGVRRREPGSAVPGRENIYNARHGHRQKSCFFEKKWNAAAFCRLIVGAVKKTSSWLTSTAKVKND
jgi:hypothetical protein